MADKRISQLNPHTSPSGSDLLVIVNNNETKKITYADLTAAITGSSTDLSGLNSFTESFNTFSASVHTEILAGTNEQDLSGLVTSVTLGILSGSVDSRLDNIELHTGSYATTGSNVFRGNQTISGSLNVVIPGGSATGMNENPTSNNIFWSYIPQDTNTTSIEVGWNAVADGFGSYIVTNVQYNNPFIYITLNDDVALPYRIRLDFSKPSKRWSFGNDGNLIASGNIIGAPNLATTGSNTFTAGQIAPSVMVDQLTVNDRANIREIRGIGGSTIDVLSNISSSYSIYARQFIGDGRYLTNLSATTDWNYNQEFIVKKTEQLTFSGDYILEDTYLIVEGGQSNTIGEWDIRIGAHNGSITKTSNTTYLIEGPNSTGGASDGNLITQYFATASSMSVGYVWNSEDAGNEFPVYDITMGIDNYPYEISTPNMLVNPTTGSETGTWSINVPADSYLTFGVWSGNSDNLTSTLQLTLPYLSNNDNVKYSPNKYFKKEGKIFIGGNLLVKDSYIENNGLISVGGEVILIGNSQIAGTGKII